MIYDIQFSSKAQKFLKKINDKNLKIKFKNAFEEIKNDPYIGDPKVGDLSGIYCYDIHYNKTNYEIAYTIHETPKGMVVVIMVGTRENFYDELKRYIN